LPLLDLQVFIPFMVFGLLALLGGLLALLCLRHWLLQCLRQQR
jgi:hypothetical protein